MKKYTDVEIFEMGLAYSINEISKANEPDHHNREALAFEVGFKRGVKYANDISASMQKQND